MSLVADYEAKIKEITQTQLGSEKILQVFWEPEAGRVAFGYRATHITKSGRKTRKWKCFTLMVIDDDMAASLKEKGISRDLWEKYLGILVDNLGLDFEELQSPSPFGEFGIIDGRFIGEPFAFCPYDDYMNIDFDYFPWYDSITTNEEFLEELANKIKSFV